MTEIHELLNLAHEHDAAAREARRTAGRLLAELRDQTPGPVWLQAIASIGLDLRAALLLIQDGVGGRERAG